MNNRHTVLGKSLHALIFNFRCPGKDLSFSWKTWSWQVQCTITPVRSDNAALTQFRDGYMYVHIFKDTATGFVFNTHKYLLYFFFFFYKANQSSFFFPLFFREAVAVPENIFLYKTATIPIFIVIVYLYQPCVNNTHVLVGLCRHWHMLLNQIIYIIKYIQTKATFLNTMYPRPNHHLDMNCDSSFIKAGKIKKGTDKFHIS